MEGKICSKCGVDRPLAEFEPKRSQCKPCKAAYYREPEMRARMTEHKRRWDAKLGSKEIVAARTGRPEVKARAKASSKRFYEKNREKLLAEYAQRRNTEPEFCARAAAYARKWGSQNGAKVAEATRRRLLVIDQAKPSWANAQDVLQIYKFSEVLTKSTGIEYQVDHIVPLRGKTVCGLHTQANLQVISAKANLQKGNRWWPNMF
jgi:5-methylcytosine-specific restriction endonuclease McrA